jgi:hypothetical protein
MEYCAIFHLARLCFSSSGIFELFCFQRSSRLLFPITRVMIWMLYPSRLSQHVNEQNLNVKDISRQARKLNDIWSESVFDAFLIVKFWVDRGMIPSTICRYMVLFGLIIDHHCTFFLPQIKHILPCHKRTVYSLLHRVSISTQFQVMGVVTVIWNHHVPTPVLTGATTNHTAWEAHTSNDCTSTGSEKATYTAMRSNRTVSCF